MWEHTLIGDTAPKTKPATQPTIVMGKKKQSESDKSLLPKGNNSLEAAKSASVGKTAITHLTRRLTSSSTHDVSPGRQTAPTKRLSPQLAHRRSARHIFDRGVFLETESDQGRKAEVTTFLTSSGSRDSRAVAARIIFRGRPSVMASFHKPSSELVKSYRAALSHLRVLIATTSQPKDLLIFGGAIISPILVRPSLNHKKEPDHKDSQDTGTRRDASPKENEIQMRFAGDLHLFGAWRKLNPDTIQYSYHCSASFFSASNSSATGINFEYNKFDSAGVDNFTLREFDGNWNKLFFQQSDRYTKCTTQSGSATSQIRLA
ncbi:hypothetical protein PROFUN_15601 [Planoprotostelium fungivorum]|uniref:Uncharacterized protein n=1 Tax=Planoprotostelium fungivorum TaxID=1890364 RepID=A0A2P6MV61_9EUKA|nr:hypothetical protein PROFUN_15601 [Planoprotostelium fungivorum]